LRATLPDTYQDSDKEPDVDLREMVMDVEQTAYTLGLLLDASLGTQRSIQLSQKSYEVTDECTRTKGRPIGAAHGD
jgi:hypothetical protein